jgi:ATP-dependent DNA helicase RecQ
LIEAREHFPKAVCVALTATATPRVRQDIKNSLHMKTGREFIASFDRENLFIRIVAKDNPQLQTIQFIQKFSGQSGIIYCYSRKQVEDLNVVLTDSGFSARPYHAGLSIVERDRNQEAFIRDDVQIIVATIAFGMGIDKPNVRFVVHFDLPKNIESYYQEIGRAGRDGLKSHCLLLFSYADVQKIKYFIDQKAPAEKRVANIHLSALLRYAESENCRRIPLLNYFGEDYAADTCNMCDNCLSQEKDMVDVTVEAQKFLSCVKRTGERFGSAHLIDVLRGSKTQKVFQFGHQTLSTYGIGKNYSKKQWQQLSRQFLHKGLMAQDMEFGSLKLTDSGWTVLRRDKTVQGYLDQEPDVAPFIEAPAPADDLTCDDRLFEILRSKRKELADEAGVPPYVIFPDKTLIEMAVFFPQSRDSLLDIHGVGTVKCQKFGELFLDIVRRYCRENQIEERPKITRRTIRSNPAKAGKPRHVHVGEIFNSGRTVQEVMDVFNIKQTTLIDHLLKYVMEGYTLRGDEIFSLSTLTTDEKNAVLKAFDHYGCEYLRPAFDALNRAVSYADLKILRLYYLIKSKKSSC